MLSTQQQQHQPQQQQPQQQDELLRGTVPLLRLTPLDMRDDLEKTWCEWYRKLREEMREQSEAEINNFLNQKVSESSAKQMEMTMGLLYGILTSANFEDSQMYLKYLNFSVRDGYANCIGQLKRLIHEKYIKLHDVPRERLVWMIGELVNLKVNDVGSLCSSIIRFIVSGDVSQRNLWLAQSLATILNNHSAWLAKNEKLLCTAVYSFMSVLLDLVMYRSVVSEPGNQLANMLTKLLIQTIRENFVLVSSIGRDFARIVFDLKSFGHAEFEQLWLDMINDPKKLDASGERYTTAMQILAAPTRARFLLSRLTPEMEKQMYFMMTQVKMGNQRRYQQWFVQKYLATNESDSLLPDLVRYTCCVYHPSHNVITANFTPRWAVLGWLLKSVKSRNGHERCKQSMIFDWLCFNPKMDSVMNIEPTMLLMLHSIPKYVDVTAALLSSLISWNANAGKIQYILPNERIAENVRMGMKILFDKGVVGSLTPITDCPQMDSKLKDMLKQQYPQYCKPVQHGALPVSGMPSPGPPSPREQQKQLQRSPKVGLTSSRQISPSSPSSPLTTDRAPSFPQKEKTRASATEKREKSTTAGEQVSPSEISTPFSAAGNNIKERIQEELQGDKAASPDDETSLSSVVSRMSGGGPSRSNIDPQLSKLFEPELSKFAGYTSFLSGDMEDDDSDDDFLDKATKSLRIILSKFEKDETLGADRIAEEQIAQKLATFIMQCLSHEFDVNARSDENYLMKSLVLSQKTILFHMFDHILNSVKPALSGSQPAAKTDTGGRRTVGTTALGSVKRKLPRLVKRSKDRFSAFLKYACSIEPSLGYRAFCFCIRKSPSIMEEIEDVLAEQLSDYHHFATRNDNSGTTAETKDDSENTVSQSKKDFLFYEYICQLRRRMGMTMMSFFVNDMEACMVDNAKLLISLIPVLSKTFSTYTRNQQFVSMFLANIMPDLLQDVLSMTAIGRSQIIHPISMKDLVQLAAASFDWDHYEQCAFWDIVLGELTFELFKLSADDDADEDVVAASTAFNFQDFMMQVLDTKKLDLRKNRHFLAKLQQFFTQHYQSSDDVNDELFDFLMTRSAKQFGSFPANFLLHWMASEPSAQQEASSCEHQKAIVKLLNKLLKTIHAQKKYQVESEWIEQARNVLVNLWHMKCGSNVIVAIIGNKSVLANLKRLKDCGFLRTADSYIKKIFCELIGIDINWEEENKKEHNSDDDEEEEEEEDDDDEEEKKSTHRRTQRKRKRPQRASSAEEKEEKVSKVNGEGENVNNEMDIDEEEEDEEEEEEEEDEGEEEEEESEEEEEEEESDDEIIIPQHRRFTRQATLFDTVTRKSSSVPKRRR